MKTNYAFVFNTSKLLSAFKGMGKKKKTKEVVDHENHKFWGKQVIMSADVLTSCVIGLSIFINVIVKTIFLFQPVPQFMDDVRVDANEPIDEPKTVADIRQVCLQPTLIAYGCS